MSGEIELGGVLGFMQALWELGQGLNRRSKAMHRGYGVTGPQRLVLLVVGRIGPVAPGRLAQVLRLHPASVTRLARTLERRQLVRRSAHPTDGRMLLLELSKRGRKVIRPRGRTVESAVRTVLGRFPKAQVSSADRLVRAIARELGA